MDAKTVKIILTCVCSFLGLISPIYTCIISSAIEKKYRFALDFYRNKIRLIKLVYWALVFLIILMTSNFAYLLIASIVYLIVYNVVAKCLFRKWKKY